VRDTHRNMVEPTHLSRLRLFQRHLWSLVCAIYLFGDHNPSSIFMCCVIYDLEGSNDANPQDANLTLVSESSFGFGSGFGLKMGTPWVGVRVSARRRTGLR
jgi:hypothetical protein